MNRGSWWATIHRVTKMSDKTYQLNNNNSIQQKTHIQNSGGGGLGGKISPNAVLVVRDGEARIINIKNQDLVTKAFEVVPELINKVKKKNEKDDIDIEVDEIINDMKNDYDE